MRLTLRPDFDVTQEDGPDQGPATGDRGGRDPGPAAAARRAAGAAARVAEPARVRLRRDRCGQVADRARPARGGHQGRDPMAGGGAGQGRVPADGGPAGPARRGGADQAGGIRRDRGRPEPARARRRTADGRRFPLQTHADLVKALFIASFRSEEPFPQVLSAALTRVYEDAGWDLALGETITPDPNPSYPQPDRPAAGRDQDGPGNRLQPADHRRRAGLHQGAAVQPAAGHHRPVPGGRPPARLRPAAAGQRGARDRGRRRRRATRPSSWAPC